MLKILLPGAIAAMLAPAALVPTAASAGPANTLAAQHALPDPGNLLEIRDRRHWDDHRRYRRGHRYREAPRHWRRYHRRPHDWRRRGCIIVGPVWFCP